VIERELVQDDHTRADEQKLDVFGPIRGSSIRHPTIAFPVSGSRPNVVLASSLQFRRRTAFAVQASSPQVLWCRLLSLHFSHPKT